MKFAKTEMYVMSYKDNAAVMFHFIAYQTDLFMGSPGLELKW